MIRKKTLPMGAAWEKAAVIQQEARKEGFDWPDVHGVLDKIREEVEELRQELEKGEEAAISEEFGDLLFSVVKLSRYIPLDPDACLSLTNEKFAARFSLACEKASREGIPFSRLSLEEMIRLWEEAKIEEPAKKDLQKLF
ncbi:MAG TPA: MazG nucleotide pyrophosphohydrolase domain-containing protein [Candidatus Mcinerneyibacteriales bacterium]|nr:MazG nucleotide pyrophosphohydrolase domain-containing protein [Candidatus Mcinerneyibacteriales bacterium]